MRLIIVVTFIILHSSILFGESKFLVSRFTKGFVSEIVAKARPDENWGGRVFSFSHGIRTNNAEVSGAVRFRIVSLSPDEIDRVKKFLSDEIKRIGYEIHHSHKSKGSGDSGDAACFLISGNESKLFITLVALEKREEIPELAGPRRSVSSYLVSFYEVLYDD